MFHTFVSTPSAAKSGRCRVKHACEHCRLFRVRCDGLQPCTRCRSQRRRCLYSRPRHQNNQPCSAESSTLDLAPESSAPPPTYPGSDVSATPVPPSASAPTSIAASVPGADPDSATAFAAKIDHYFASISTLVPGQVLESHALPQYSASASILNLTSAQRSALLRLYARRLHPTVPIVDLDQVRAHCRDDDPPPLLCAILALSIQYAACSGLAARVLDLAIPGIDACPDASLAGYEMITRCRSLLAGASLEPSLAEVQCHVFMALYLINAGQLKAAYNLLGSTVRIASSLDLHRPQPDSAGKLHCRLWWSLVQLDLKCSSLLARPAAFHPSDMSSCRFPTDTHGDLSFYDYSVKLTAAVLSATTTHARQREFDGADSLNFNEARARTLTDQLGQILEWEASIPQTGFFSDLELDPYATIARFEETQDQVSVGDEKCSLQHILLKAYYHNSLMGLLRSFISFPFKSISSIRSPWVDKHATDAVAHALALTATIVETFRLSDMLHGWCDIYQSLWNALLTMAGFVVSYPLCRMSGTARRLFPTALSIFEMVSLRIATAARFLTLGKDLFSRIERLVAFVEENQRGKEELASANASSLTNAPAAMQTRQGSTISSPTLGADGPNTVGDIDQATAAHTGAEGSEQPFFDYDDAEGTCEQGLWSWMDIIDTPNWPDYQDGIDKLFAEITDLDMLMEEQVGG